MYASGRTYGNRIPVGADFLHSRILSVELANKIERCWHERGLTWARVWVERDDSFTKPVYCIRSNMKFRATTNQWEFDHAVS